MAKRGPGKFDSDLDAVIYSLSLDGGPDEEMGEADTTGWYGLMRDGAGIAEAIKERQRFAPEEVEGVSPADLEFLCTDGAAGIVLYVNSPGFVKVAYYAKKSDLDRDWKEVEESIGGGEDEFEENRPRRRNAKESKLERDGTLGQLLDMEAESADLPREYRGELEITDELSQAATEYETALHRALVDMVFDYPTKEYASADTVMDEGDAPYNVLMTLRGEGVGIWDGRWDQFYDKKTLEKAQAFLKKKLGGYADITGSGKLGTAFMNAVYENEQRLGIERDDDGNFVEGEEQEENRRHRNGPGQARFNVTLGKDHVDVVYFDEDMTADDVKRSLVDHDGYDDRITVKKMERRRTGVPASAYLENAHKGKLRYGDTVRVGPAYRMGASAGRGTRAPDEWTGSTYTVVSLPTAGDDVGLARHSTDDPEVWITAKRLTKVGFGLRK